VPARVVRPNSKLLTESGYPSVAHVPFLVGEDGSYLALENRYIRARALCEWPLRMGTNNEPAKTRRAFLTVASCVALARRMRELVVWAEARIAHEERSSFSTMSYADICHWQSGLASGALSSSGRPLASATINIYVAEACYFLTWLSLVPRREDGTQERPAFELMTREFRIAHRDGRHAHVQLDAGVSRIGRLDVVPSRELALPTPVEVELWLRAMRQRSPVKALMAEVIITSGMRISEVNSMEVDTLPPRARWKIVGGHVYFFINKGVKGAKTEPTSNIARRGRTVSLPLDVAERVRAYQEEMRELQMRRWIRLNPDKAEQARRAGAKPKLLWLSETSNQPFANQQLRRVWSDAACCPPGWSPHAGRKYFAVEWLVESARLRLSVVDGPADFGWIDQVMRNQIDTFLRPTLGHLSLETTNLYIRGAMWRLADVIGMPSLKYQDAQDTEGGATSQSQATLETAVPVRRKNHDGP